MWSRRRMGAAVVAAALVVGVSACGDDDGDALRADAGDDFETPVGSSPVFDGCASTGSITNYAWVIVGAPDDMGGDVGKSLKDLAAECSFELEAAMLAEEVGTWTIELTVTDAEGATSSDQVQVAVVAE